MNFIMQGDMGGGKPDDLPRRKVRFLAVRKWDAHLSAMEYKRAEIRRPEIRRCLTSMFQRSGAVGYRLWDIGFRPVWMVLVIVAVTPMPDVLGSARVHDRA